MSKQDLKSQISQGSKTRFGTDVSQISADFKEEEHQKPHTLTIRPSFIEKIKDYVHFKKVSGEPYYTQGDAVEEALSMLFSEIDPPQRPAELRKKEMKRTGRKKSTGSITTSNISENPFQ